MARDNTISLANSFKQKIDAYFERLSVLVSQIPYELRLLLLPEYMTWNTFQGEILLDPFGNFGFEIHRKSETKLEIKIKTIHDPVEKKIFGFYHPHNAPRISGQNIKLVNIRHTVNRGMSVVIVEIADVRFIQYDILTNSTEGRRFFKKIPFAWVVDKSLVNSINALSYADQDFYDPLFSNIREILSEGYRYLEEDKSKVRNFYIGLLQKIENEINDRIKITQTNEWTFQQLLNRYKFFLCPAAEKIEGNYIIKNNDMIRKPDFHIQVNKVKRIDVEIEPPFYKPFQGEKISSRLQGALKQVLDWKQISSVNEGEKNICYVIIIGLKADLNAIEIENLQKFNDKQTDLLVVTWDWIVDNVKQVISDLKNKI